MWSLGVIAYTMLCGFPPFYSENDAELLDLIALGEFDFPDPWYAVISGDITNTAGGN